MTDYPVTVTNENNYTVEVTSTDITVTIPADEPNYTIEVGIQGPSGVTGPQGPIGPQGVQGPPGVGTATVQDTPPLVGTDGELWFDDNTNILRVYANGDWQIQTLEDGYF